MALKTFFVDKASPAVSKLGHQATIGQIYDLCHATYSAYRIKSSNGKWVISASGTLQGSNHTALDLKYGVCTDICNTIIKPALAAPLYYFGTIDRWSQEQPNPFILDAAAHYNRSVPDRLAYMYNILANLVRDTTVNVPPAQLLAGMVVSYLGETNGEIFLHNSFAKGNSVYTKGDAKPNSTSFGLGQWLNNRLVAFVYFCRNLCISTYGHADVPISMMYSPFVHFKFLFWEMENYDGLKAKLEQGFKTGAGGAAVKAGYVSNTLSYFAAVFIQCYQGVPIGHSDNSAKAKTAKWLKISDDVENARMAKRNSSLTAFSGAVKSSKINIYA